MSDKHTFLLVIGSIIVGVIQWELRAPWIAYVVTGFLLGLVVSQLPDEWS